MNNIVPNYTTSGYRLSDAAIVASRKYCGAVAVSWYRTGYTLSAIERLIQAGVKTNVHYVLSRRTMEEAVLRLQNDDFPRGVNAVIFLSYKPVGQGTAENVLQARDDITGRFFRQITLPHPFKVGVDSCLTPGIVACGANFPMESIDTCEGARFSCYIDSEMNMSPCSFDRSGEYMVSLKEMTIASAWNSPQFELFRDKLRGGCAGCGDRGACMGGCPLLPEIVLCDRSVRSRC